jgi:hypothetical protein
MAIQLIDIGQVANDGTGDDLREAMIKINQNFEELDLRDDEQTTASNIGGDGGVGIFSNRVNYDLQFKKLVAGSNINITPTDSTIVVDVPQVGLQQLILSGDNGSLIVQEGDTINIVGGAGVRTAIVDNTLTIENTSSEIVTDETPQLGGNLDAQGNNINNVGSIDAANITGFLTGNVNGLVYDVDIRELSEYVNDFNFGGVVQDITSPLQWILAGTEFDMGSFGTPELRSIDFGSF